MLFIISNGEHLPDFILTHLPRPLQDLFFRYLAIAPCPTLALTDIGYFAYHCPLLLSLEWLKLLFHLEKFYGDANVFRMFCLINDILANAK